MSICQINLPCDIVDCESNYSVIWRDHVGYDVHTGNGIAIESGTLDQAAYLLNVLGRSHLTHA